MASPKIALARFSGLHPQKSVALDVGQAHEAVDL